jgi:hypothetical protein
MKCRTLLALVIAVALAPAGFAKTDSLALIPNDAVTVGVVRLADMRTSPLSSMLFQQTDKIASNGDAERFLTEAGLQPSKDIDVLVVSTVPSANLGGDANVLIAADGRFNVHRVTAALTSRGAVNKNGYFVLPESQREGGSQHTGAVAFPDSHLALIGTEEAVANALANYAAGGTTFLTASGLGREIARIDHEATAWAIVDVARAQRLTNAPRVPAHGESSGLASALKSISTVVLWATDTGHSLKLSGVGVGHDAETLQLVEDTLRGALAAVRLAVQDKSPDLVPVLRKFAVTRSNDTVSINGTIPAETLKTLLAKQRAAHAAHEDSSR